ncbi:glycine betaine ABC transporter substrate-binding protein [Streptococcus pacificus]|uniref:ABC transporter permease/substrate-binding protein n=1 Tax=Streptococcus pacificus TaxID=2740577 RepID=A0ABS0ZI15_9STRE|nr:ABC transporter permease/substrate-binding protein [Streptococcus pacificus]
MMPLIDTFNERFSDWTNALVEHLQISLLALLISVFIAVPLAVLLAKNKKVSELVLHIAGIFQTVPSLALLGLFIPFMGIGTVPAVSTLIIYSLFPILQNTITALRGIDPSLKEAATAFGMTRWEKLKKFEIPISMPVIMSGIRTSAVMIIGTATLAALIGAGGLGSFILLGIDRNNTSLILIGALSSAFLAIIFNLVLGYLEKARLRRIMAVFLAMIVGLVISFLPDLHMMPNQNQKEIIIAGKLGPEPEILSNMYKELIEDKSDITVTLKPNFGKTTFLYEALKSGDIDAYVEYTGTVTSSLLKNPVEVSNDPDEVYELAKTEINKQDQLAYLKPMLFQNTYALAVTRDLAEKYDLKTISDLNKVGPEVVAGFTLEFNDREDGYKGLQSLYGLNLNVKTMEPALRYQAISSGDIQIMDAYSTDSEIKEFDLVLLKDDKQLFPPYQGAPLLRNDVLEKYPELRAIFEELSGKITEEEMSEMNYQVKAQGKSAKEVAHDYLVSHQLISE